MTEFTFVDLNIKTSEFLTLGFLDKNFFFRALKQLHLILSIGSITIGVEMSNLLG